VGEKPLRREGDHKKGGRLAFVFPREWVNKFNSLFLVGGGKKEAPDAKGKKPGKSCCKMKRGKWYRKKGARPLGSFCQGWKTKK